MIKAWLFDAADYEPWTKPFDPAIAADLTAWYLDLWTRAEEMGFDGIFFSEHHFAGWSLSPSPNLLLAATAARTKRIRLGVMAQVLPMYEPWRVAEECAMLDHISQGRLEIGLARGTGAADTGRLGMPPDEARQRFDEGLEIIKLALTRPSFSYDGRYTRLTDFSITPRALQQPMPPTWISVRTPASAANAVKHGYKACSGLSPTDEVKEAFDAYREAGAELGIPTGPDQLGLRRHILVTDSDATAREQARIGMEKELAKLGGPEGPLARVIRSGVDVIAGSPATVAAQIVDQCRTVGAGHILKLLPGSFTREQKEKSCALFAREVIPVLHREDISTSSRPTATVT
jgi:alkanesulfonate monooxygenase SsuD/methylene tetrahydromethanopterin reductase-like flavin-dependent oxidoreductase (luciferase family)